jgi:hypothetical protein
VDARLGSGHGCSLCIALHRGLVLVALLATRQVGRDSTADIRGFLDERRLILLFPLVFHNTGARDYVVRDLRVRFGDESVGVPLDWERVRGGVDASAYPTGSWLPHSPYPVAQGCASSRSLSDGLRIEPSTPEPIRACWRA